MKVILLAAGYATRLYPLTENFPKPLLEVKGKTILDWLIEDIEADEFIVISNHKFAHFFNDWKSRIPNKNISVVDDGTSTNETRLGALKDIQCAIKERNISDDVLIIAGDNLIDFSMNKYLDFIKEKNTSCVMTYYEKDENKLHGYGILELNDDLIVGMEEKPANPKSHYVGAPFYFYKKEDIARLDEAINSGCGVDAPGSLIAWMCKNSVMHAYKMPGHRYDIGTLESYEDIKKNFGGKVC